MAKDAQPLNGGRSFNLKTRHWRKPWRDLDEKGRKRRYQQAVVAHANGLPSPPGTFADFAKRQRALDRHQRVEKPSYRGRVMPAFFGSSARTQILAILAANGPMTVRDLARLRRKDSATTFRAVERLIRCGLVTKRLRPGGRKYVGINRAHAALPELLALLRVLGDIFGVPLLAQARHRWGLPTVSDPTPPIAEEWMFGSPVRSRMLVLLAVAGEADEMQMARVLTASVASVWYTSNALSKTHRILRSRRVGTRRVFSLSPTVSAIGEFRAFLLSLAGRRPIYHTLSAAIAPTTRRWR
jgi:DNA-binding transcriptional ArsR family regulator